MSDWKIFAFGSAVFAGLTALLAKIGVKDIPSNLATFIRTIVIIFFLGILVLLRGEWQNPMLLNRKSLIFLVLSGITTGLSWLCYYRALQTGPVTIVAPIDKLSLVFAILFSFVFLQERPNGVEWAGISLVALGVLIVAFK